MSDLPRYGSYEQYFLEMWKSVAVDYKLPSQSDRWRTFLCEPAAEFDAWCHGLLDFYLNPPSDNGITLAMSYLQDAYFERRESVSRPHRDTLGSARHTCLHTVYEHAYKQLKAMRMALRPSLVVAPSGQRPHLLLDATPIGKETGGVGDVPEEGVDRGAAPPAAVA